jgi:hypothetical protein
MKQWEFVTKNRNIIIALIVLLSGAVAFFVWVHWISAAPLDQPISLAPMGRVDNEICVPLSENYELVFVFDRANRSFYELQRLIGEITYNAGKSTDTGVKIPVRWALFARDSQQTVASGEIESAGSSGWANTFVERKIGNIKVEPGKYRFHAEILRDVPELKSLKTNIAIELVPKFTTSWQMAVSWWGSMVVFILIIPTIVVLTLVLLIRGTRKIKGDGGIKL